MHRCPLRLANYIVTFGLKDDSISTCPNLRPYLLSNTKNNQTLHIQVRENVNEFRNLVSDLNEIINKYGETSINHNSSNKLLYSNEYNDLIYLGGHPSIPPSQEVRVLYIDSENISIRDIENVYNIPLNKVISYRIESKKEIKERVT